MNSVRTSKRTPHFTITKINWIMLFKEIITVYSKRHTICTNTKYSVTDCQDCWDIQLPLGFKGFRPVFDLEFVVTSRDRLYVSCKIETFLPQKVSVRMP
jgi:hypothetical protein